MSWLKNCSTHLSVIVLSSVILGNPAFAEWKLVRTTYPITVGPVAWVSSTTSSPEGATMHLVVECVYQPESDEVPLMAYITSLGDAQMEENLYQEGHRQRETYLKEFPNSLGGFGVPFFVRAALVAKSDNGMVVGYSSREGLHLAFRTFEPFKDPNVILDHVFDFVMDDSTSRDALGVFALTMRDGTPEAEVFFESHKLMIEVLPEADSEADAYIENLWFPSYSFEFSMGNGAAAIRYVQDACMH